MMVVFQSECEKNSLQRTRRVLDSFANRIGQRSWQTVITAEGLDAVRKLLLKSASKNTSIACHLIHGPRLSELLWVVGNRDKFNDNGYTPVNTTKRDQLNLSDESAWHFLPSIKALTALAGLFHDLGKASGYFQEKLLRNYKTGDPIRHEWISYLLFFEIIKNRENDDDASWLKILTQESFEESILKIRISESRKKEAIKFPPVAELLIWLIITHHRMPYLPYEMAKGWRDEPANDLSSILKSINQSWGYENRFDEDEYNRNIRKCFVFPKGLLHQSQLWIKQIKKWAQRLLDCLPVIERCIQDGTFRILLHYSRTSLMLGDYYYSSSQADSTWNNTTNLIANTDQKTKKPKQQLDEHLVGVAKSALNIAHLIPKLENSLGMVQNQRTLKEPSPFAFHWQNIAVQKIRLWRTKPEASKMGFFAVNMASTGSGKTFANAKIMQAISQDGDALRFTLALGLRTLTLQTGDEYRNRIGLDESQLAVIIGSLATLELHNQDLVSNDFNENDTSGSESIEKLLSYDIDYSSLVNEEFLATIFKEQKDRQLLSAPVLACTIDHMMAATETTKGGRYILPTLRMMSSDLVIDEVDDFTGSDLVAIGRLIHLAGLLGRKVMISSATIPPDLAEGYFNAYYAGWQLFSKTRNVDNSIECAWIDEFKTQLATLVKNNENEIIESFRDTHNIFIRSRVENLNRIPARRKADIIMCEDLLNQKTSDEIIKQQEYFRKIRDSIIIKHEENHIQDKVTGKSISFGVVRMANIGPCVLLSKYLMTSDWPFEIDVRVMAYHSQQVLLLRHEQEKHLDSILKRGKENQTNQPILDDTIIRRHLENSRAKNLIFILVATPVEEVGRDHDFDWAVIEPSSYRSIVQLSGRVRRHRDGEVRLPNISILQYNWAAIRGGEKPDRACFMRPGYEEGILLKSHDLMKLVDLKKIADKIDAVPRIQKNIPNDFLNTLSGLEHEVTRRLVANYLKEGPEELNGYLNNCWYLTALPQVLNAFRKSEPDLQLFVMYEPDLDQFTMVEKDDQGNPVDRGNILRIKIEELDEQLMSKLWLYRDYKQLLVNYAEINNCTLKTISLRYGELRFLHRENQDYVYSDQFGIMNC